MANPCEITWDAGGKAGQQGSGGRAGSERDLSQSCSSTGLQYQQNNDR